MRKVKRPLLYLISCSVLLAVLFLSYRTNPASPPPTTENQTGPLRREVTKWILPPDWGQKPHVILISLDTLRADHLSSYGYWRATSPFLDELAGRGVRFEQVISQAPRTAPSHMSLFTGLYPAVHKTRLAYGRTEATIFPLNDRWGTLPQWFKKAKYRTAAWTGGVEMLAEAGFDRGFDEYHETLGYLTSEKLAHIRQWFLAHSDEPCFIFLHTYQIHDPYLPPQPYNEFFDPHYEGGIISEKSKLVASAEKDYFSLHEAFWERVKRTNGRIEPREMYQLEALYDGEILYTDHMLKEFFGSLKSDGLLEDTLVVITADHGEEFLEHGELLHKTLYQETLRVPLIMSYSGRLPPGMVVKSQVGLIDLAPTILEIAGFPVPEQIQSASLMPLIMGDEVGDREVYSEEPWRYLTHHSGLRTGRFVLYDKGWLGKELYDQRADPGERTDISSRQRETRAWMEERISYWTRMLRPEPDLLTKGKELSDERVRALRSLGYMQ